MYIFKNMTFVPQHHELQNKIINNNNTLKNWFSTKNSCWQVKDLSEVKGQLADSLAFQFMFFNGVFTFYPAMWPHAKKTVTTRCRCTVHRNKPTTRRSSPKTQQSSRRGSWRPVMYELVVVDVSRPPL